MVAGQPIVDLLLLGRAQAVLCSYIDGTLPGGKTFQYLRERGLKVLDLPRHNGSKLVPGAAQQNESSEIHFSYRPGAILSTERTAATRRMTTVVITVPARSSILNMPLSRKVVTGPHGAAI